MITKQNFIIFSSIDWNTHWQLHHQLVASIVESGGKVLYIENTGTRSPQIRDFNRIIDRIKIRFNSIHGFKDIENNVTIFTPIFIPYPYNKLSIFLNTLFISRSIRSWIKAAKFSESICISFLPTPAVQGIVEGIDPSLKIYYCADNMSRSLVDPGKLIKYENRFFKDVDLVFTTSHKMYKKALQFSDCVYNVPTGIDSSKFPPLKSLTIPSDIEKIPRPIIGYIGAISEVFNKDLIIRLANFLPNVSIVLVGPIHTNIAILKNIKNITILSERAHDLMPNYINSFDIALIPYIVNEATDSVYSCKLNEYLSLGKIVLSTNLQEIRIFNEQNNNLINIGVNTEDFIHRAKKIIETLAEDTEENRIRRINIAKKNTWDDRFSKIYMAIDESLESKLSRKNNWRDALVNKYKRSNHAIISKLSFILVFYFLIFHSPLFWLMGEQLVERDLAKKSDAIVVFSGDGEVSYQNLSYQKRAINAIKFYNEGFSDKIFLSSGRKQTIADVDMIKLYLVSRGVSKSSIYVLEKYPSSTYENVKMIKQVLDENKVSSILFITSPYHSRRAVLTWKRNAPDINIITPDIESAESKGVKWGVGLDKMRVIVYEYAAIVHNWLKGRI
jgi:uncharacterized SAM-binding protein YcdF (DUF218 family)